MIKKKYDKEAIRMVMKMNVDGSVGREIPKKSGWMQ